MSNSPLETGAHQNLPARPFGPSKWEEIVAARPEHSRWYIERFKEMAAAGNDLAGEARFVDAMVGRGAKILDAGSGPGRVGGFLLAAGHRVSGVDVDPALIAEAQLVHPEGEWVVGDLAELNPANHNWVGQFDAIVVAGNVLTFLAEGSHGAALANLNVALAPAGRIAVGFGMGRGYEVAQWEQDVAEAGLVENLRLATWDLKPWTSEADFLVSILAKNS